MSNIDLNYTQIIDPVSFKSINLAKIYIGEYGTLPNPANASTWKQAYFVNSDGTRTAASQPIRTNAAGYAVDGSGNIKTVQVDGGYSLLAQDQFNATKFSTAKAADIWADLASPTGSALIGAATYAQLRAYSGDATRMQVGGRVSYFDGAGGIFVRTGSAADNDGTVLKDALGRSWKREVDNPLRPEWFGAIGDGIVDDTAAIQAAFNSLTSESAIYFPSGTYLVSPTVASDYILKLPNANNLTVYGEGVSSVIKVKGGAGNYAGIIGYVANSEPKGLTVRDITFDHNAQNNTFSSIVDYDARVRSTVSTYARATNWDRMQFLNITVLNCDSIVSLYFPRGTAFGGSVLVDGCSWVDARNGNGQDFDQSFINCTCEFAQITNCQFRGASWALAPRTAIEPHASDSIISGNAIRYFQVGMNLTGISQAGTTYRHICSNNTMMVCRDGLLIWSQTLAPTNADVGFEGMIIENNVIDMSPYNYMFGNPSIGYKGIAFYGGANHRSLKRLVIADNVISYPIDISGNSYSDRSASKNWGAIGAYSLDTAYTQEDVTIRGNMVKNCAHSALFFDIGVWKGMQIEGNTFVNCGTSKSASPAVANLVPLYFTATLESDLQISRNTFIDLNSAPLITDVIFLRDRRATPVYTTYVLDNVFEFADGANLAAVTDYVGVATSTTLVRFIGDVPTDTIRLPAITGGIGSVATVKSSGAKVVKSQSGVTAWTQVLYGSAAPTTGTWRVGDTVYNATPTAGGFMGWVCTVAGTPGTWKTFGAISA